MTELDERYQTGGNRIFYLAVAPDYFEPIVHNLDRHHFLEDRHAWQRLVIEKPFGKDLTTARNLNNKINSVFSESQIYRIDHYLGKEMIQNILVLRFCNSVFESLWSNKFIDNIQISLNETEGVGTRGGYYEKAGAVRDMVQNHILQILSFVAMEPPVSLHTDAIRSEKLKAIQSIEELTPDLLHENIVFGQYGKGIVTGKPVAAYIEEDQVKAGSDTETFIGFKLHLNNFRWAGTPFYIRTGKRLTARSASIVIQFEALPQILYFKDRDIQEPNLLVIKIQPDVGVFFQFNTKDFGTHDDIVAVKMDTGNVCPMQGNTPEAYERLILDILRGDTTLFSRWDEVEASWKFADKIVSYRERQQLKLPIYQAGTMGPQQAEDLITKDGRKWWDL